MLGISTTTTTAALIAVKIGLCLSPFAACRLQFGFYSAIFCCSVLVVVVVTVAIAVLFNYNYLFNHNFVRVSTIINHQMHHADSGRQNSVTGPTVSLTDWPLSAREQQAASRKPEKEMELLPGLVKPCGMRCMPQSQPQLLLLAPAV